MNFAFRLHAARTGKGWSNVRLGIEADVSPSYIAMLENGQREGKLEILERLATALDVRVSWLVFGEGPPSSKTADIQDAVDFVQPEFVELEISADGKTAYAHVNGVTAFRAGRIGQFVLTDHRPTVERLARDHVPETWHSGFPG